MFQNCHSITWQITMNHMNCFHTALSQLKSATIEICRNPSFNLFAFFLTVVAFCRGFVSEFLYDKFPISILINMMGIRILTLLLLWQSFTPKSNFCSLACMLEIDWYMVFIICVAMASTSGSCYDSDSATCGKIMFYRGIFRKLTSSPRCVSNYSSDFYTRTSLYQMKL